MNLIVDGEQLDLDPGRTAIYYVDEKPPEFSMQGLKAGIIAVIVVVTIAIIAGIVVLVGIEQVKFHLRVYILSRKGDSVEKLHIHDPKHTNETKVFIFLNNSL